MTLPQLLRILYARKAWIIGTVVICLTFAMTAAWLLPSKYMASASVVVGMQGDDPVRAPGSQGSTGPTVATQADIIKRPRVAQQVVTDLGLKNDPKFKEAWQKATDGLGDFGAWIGGAVLGGLTVAPGADSNVIDIRYSSTDPDYAARMANAFADAFVRTTLELKTSPARQFTNFFDQRVSDLRGQLEQAQTRLSTYERENGVNASGKIDVENARLTELSAALGSAQSQLADSSSRSGGAKGDASISPEVMQNPLVQTLKGALATQQVKIQVMSQQYGPNNPELQRARREEAELIARINAETGKVTSSLGTANRVSTQRVAELQTAVETQRKLILSLGEKRDKADLLQKEVTNAQRSFDLVMQRQSQTALESQVQQTDVAVLDHATAPLRPTSPNRPLIIVLSLIGGLLLGVPLALVREFANPRVRGVDDLAYYLDLPVLSVIPPLIPEAKLRLTGSRRAVRLIGAGT